MLGPVKEGNVGLPERGLSVQRSPVEVERSQQHEGVASGLWFPGLAELDTGRESDGMERTAAPVDPGKCAWCGTPGTGVLCEGCGRRRLRGPLARPAAVAAAGVPLTARQRTDAEEDTVLCPGCLTRVVRAEKCPECMSPLPRGELF